MTSPAPAIHWQIMADYSPHQKKAIDRYYDNHRTILLTRLGDIVTDLYLADSDAKRDRLWQRAAQAMAGLDIAPELTRHILRQRKPEVLARNLSDWLDEAARP